MGRAGDFVGKMVHTVHQHRKLCQVLVDSEEQESASLGMTLIS